MRSLTSFQKTVVVSIFIFLLGGASVRLYYSFADRSRLAADLKISQEPDPVVQVHVKGAVKNPGLYSLKTGARVSDAVTTAGGFRDDAQYENLNLAAILEDGQEIIIPPPGPYESKRADDPLPEGWTININVASSIDLQRISGIGPSLAGKIVALRENRGPYKTIEEIKFVRGIGDGTFARIKQYLRVE